MTQPIAKVILRHICSQTPNITNGIHVGVYDSGGMGGYMILCYNTSSTDNDGVPAYAWGIAFSGNYISLIKSVEYVVSFKNVTLT